METERPRPHPRSARRRPMWLVYWRCTRRWALSKIGENINPRRTVRLVLVALGISLGFTTLAALWLWLEDHLPQATLWGPNCTACLHWRLAMAW